MTKIFYFFLIPLLALAPTILSAAWGDPTFDAKIRGYYQTFHKGSHAKYYVAEIEEK